MTSFKSIPIFAVSRSVLWVILMFASLESSAVACTQEAAWASAVAIERAHRKMKKVRGTFIVTSVTTRLGQSDFSDDDEIEIKIYLGQITTRSGKVYQTEHEDDGDIRSCGDFYKPTREAKGWFFLSKRPSASTGRFELKDWDGDYSPLAEKTEKKD